MEMLVTSHSPVCDLEAVLTREADGYYFSLLYHPAAERKTIRRCRIGNTDIPVQVDKLTLIWYPSCDSAAVFHGDDLLCAIPPEANAKGFPGFSCYAKGKAPLAWAFSPDEETVEKRVLESAKFWGWMRRDDCWSDVQKRHLGILDHFFGAYEQYFAIDGDKFPPRALVTGRRSGTVYGITIGMSLFQMPKAAYFCGKYALDFCRTELGFAVSEQLQGFVEVMAPQLSWMAAHPWEKLTMLLHGDTVNLSNVPGFPAAVLIHPDAVTGMEKPVYPAFWGCPINLLWVVPVTQQEMMYLKQHNVAALLQHVCFPERLHIFDGTPKFLR